MCESRGKRVPASVVPYRIFNRTLDVMHVVYYNRTNGTTAPPTINGYDMHVPTEVSTPLPTMVHNVIF